MYTETESTTFDELIKYKVRINVCGTRDYNDYDYFSNKINSIISKYQKEDIAFISGAAKSGADALIIKWCKENKFYCVEFPAKWDLYNKSAGYVRNIEMSEYQTELIAFWDGKSNGTKHMIDTTTKLKMPVSIFNIEINKVEYTYFFRKESPFSKHYLATFIINGIEFNCTEQFLMYCKARLFNDYNTAEKILQTNDPIEHKRLGRLVNNFNEEIWIANRMKFNFIGNLNKFKQNPYILNTLLDTKDNILVEASPFDKIWGVGLKETDPRIKSSKMWRGLNLHGETLMRVRDKLSKKEL